MWYIHVYIISTYTTVRVSSRKNLEAACRKVLWGGSCKLAFGNIIAPNQSDPQQLAFLGGKLPSRPLPPTGWNSDSVKNQVFLAHSFSCMQLQCGSVTITLLKLSFKKMSFNVSSMITEWLHFELVIAWFFYLLLLDVVRGYFLILEWLRPQSGCQLFWRCDVEHIDVYGLV